MLDQDGFVKGMCAFTDSSQSIECWNPQRSGEVSIGPSASTLLFECESEFRGVGTRLLKERSDLPGPLHWWAIDAAGDFKFAPQVDGGE